MFRCKSNTKALIMTALIILLCFVCLMGATLALFTNGEGDGLIGIITTSGLVKVDIVDTAGVTLQGKALLFMTTSGTTDSDKVWFEPGATFYTQGFQIKNIGNIPVNFRLSVCEDDVIDINGKPVTMKEFRETFDVWITTNPNDPSCAIEMKPFEGKLEAEGVKSLSETYYLVVKMKETAGNEFQDQSYSGIGITVYAVQGNLEKY